MNGRKMSRVFVAVSALALTTALMVSGSMSCGGRWVHKSTIYVGTTDAQQAFYAALIAVNAYHYPFAEVDAASGRIVTGQVELGGGNWFSFNILVAPSGEVIIIPYSPTATYWLSPYVTEERALVVPEFCVAQVIPSRDVRIVPFKPTATNWLSLYVTEKRCSNVTGFCIVHVVPSGEVKIKPAPAATNWPLP